MSDDGDKAGLVLTLIMGLMILILLAGFIASLVRLRDAEALVKQCAVIRLSDLHVPFKGTLYDVDEGNSVDRHEWE